MKKYFLLVVVLMLNLFSIAQNKKEAAMHAYVNKLLAKMTLEEKLGQLNLPAASDFVTGQVSSTNIAAKVVQGKLEEYSTFVPQQKLKNCKLLQLLKQD